MPGASGGIPVYDPRGRVEAEAVAIAPRAHALEGLRVAVLDNTKWNANKLLRRVSDRLSEAHGFADLRYYRKESFSKVAAPELIDEIAANSDIVVTAIGD